MDWEMKVFGTILSSKESFSIRTTENLKSSDLQLSREQR